MTHRAPKCIQNRLLHKQFLYLGQYACRYYQDPTWARRRRGTGGLDLSQRWRYRGGQHTSDGVFDRITMSFVRYIWRYRRTMRPTVKRLIA